MRFWFSRGSEVSIRDQLTTQIILSILSGELKPGQRLPSTRELARRFDLHPNTVSAGYRTLEHSHWVELRKGSGVYVRQQKSEAVSPELALDQLIRGFFNAARQGGIPLQQIHWRLQHWMALQPPDHFLLIEPDPALAQIVGAEIQSAVTMRVKTSGIDPVDLNSALVGAVPVALSMNENRARACLTTNPELFVLHLRSAGTALAAHLPAPSTALVAIASIWPTFLKTGRTMLIAAGFHPDSLILRDVLQSNWRRGLDRVSAVICDSVTAKRLNGLPRILTFPLLSEESVQELKQYEEFIRNPIST